MTHGRGTDMRKPRNEPDPEYYDFESPGFAVGEARSGRLNEPTAAEKKRLREREARKFIGFALKDSEGDEIEA